MDETIKQTIKQQAEKLFQLCREQDLTIATAESCTGGLVAAALTAMPGASRVFVAGLVCYANQAKMKFLSVERALLKEEGAVSVACARAMAEGALAQTGSSLALATTGIAGPDGGSPTHPVGLVHIAVATKNETRDKVCHFGSVSRAEIRTQSTSAVLALAVELVQ